MELSRGNKRNIAKIVFISFVLTLLLSFNYKAWGGCYNGGGFEDLVITQNAEWNHSVIANSKDGGNHAVVFASCHHTPISGWSGVFFSSPALLLHQFVKTFENRIYFSDIGTPILLSVRKNE